MKLSLQKIVIKDDLRSYFVRFCLTWPCTLGHLAILRKSPKNRLRKITIQPSNHAGSAKWRDAPSCIKSAFPPRYDRLNMSKRQDHLVTFVVHNVMWNMDHHSMWNCQVRLIFLISNLITLWLSRRCEKWSQLFKECYYILVISPARILNRDSSDVDSLTTWRIHARNLNSFLNTYGFREEPSVGFLKTVFCVWISKSTVVCLKSLSLKCKYLKFEWD